ncbi:MAG TPA: DUF1549 domain-containing protein [Planctomycetota bacterium]|nr:DUF1549 domain-containing protein [Planctomycetota bacterium]
MLRIHRSHLGLSEYPPASLAPALLILFLAMQVRTVAQDPVDFNRDIRPLLSENCFNCHGFDAQQRKADLRLDTREGLFSERKGRSPVVPGEPSKSEILVRIAHADEAHRMPPKSTGLSIPSEGISLLTRWIEEGAVYSEHWAFLPLQKVPKAERQAAGEDAIRNHVAAGLRPHGLDLAPEADRATLIRRLSLDLLGLPPTPQEVDDFVNAPDSDAYEKLVDRLLASPHYGERMAVFWMDLARYADTNGFHHDNIRTGWPYRDWVIRSFNEDLPYDRFMTLQLAGDLVPNATDDDRIASAFSRMHNMNDEGGALDPEYRVEAIADRIETTSTVFLGLTYACARCHDHKYDPITQEDYYSLAAFFNSVDEMGVYPHNFEQARAYPARLDFVPESLKARLAVSENAVAEANRSMEVAAASARGAFDRMMEARRRELRLEWGFGTFLTATRTSGGPIQILPGGVVRMPPKGAPDRDTISVRLRTDATGLKFLRLQALPDPAYPNGRVGLAPNGNAVLSHVEARVTSLKDPTASHIVDFSHAWADHEQRNGDFDVRNALIDDAAGWALDGHGRAGARTAVFLSDSTFGYAGGSVVDITLKYQSPYPAHLIGRVHLMLGRGADLLSEFPLVMGDWWQSSAKAARSFDEAFDKAFGPEDLREPFERSQAHGFRHKPDIVDGVPVGLTGERSAFYFARSLRVTSARQVRAYFGSDDGLRVMLNGQEVLARKVQRGVAPDQDSVVLDLRPGENILIAKVVNDGGPGGFFARFETMEPEGGSPVVFLGDPVEGAANLDAVVDGWLAHISPEYREQLQARRAAEQHLADLSKERVPVPVMREKTEPTPTFVLARGHYEGEDRSRPVGRTVPAFLGTPFPQGAPRNRLGYAAWLALPEHPLFLRVHVNRLWQLLFGTGLVATAENFGVQSEWPSHPGLLDHLAIRFRELGMSHKALLREIVLSAVYRQESRLREDLSAVDPANRLLGSFPRRRLPAEFLRDQALFVSELLDPSMLGPSVRPYQPGGLWREVSIGPNSNTQVFVQGKGADLHRRSLYTFWKRTAPNPQMMIFDAPTREFCVVRRSLTNTPLQALVLWNDVQFLEAARSLAESTLKQDLSDLERIQEISMRCTSVRRSDSELVRTKEALLAWREDFAADRDRALALISIGDTPPSADHPPQEVAAWTMIAHVFLNLDATVVRP